MNAILFGLVVFLSARLIQYDFRPSRAYALLGVCAVLFSRPLSEVYAQTLSECLFIPSVLLYLISTQRYWGTGRRRSLAVMTLATALACITRYIGVALVPAGVLTIILASNANFRKRLSRASVFAAFSLAPLGLWAVRNYHLTKTIFGFTGSLKNTLADNVTLCFQTIVPWYTPGIRGTKYIVLAGVAIALVALVASRGARVRMWRSLKALLSNQPPALLLSASYLITLLVAARRDAVIDSRMLSPIFIPASLVLLRLAYDLLGPNRPVPRAIASTIPLVFLALWLSFPVGSVALDTAARFMNGAGGYNTRAWRESETVAFAKEILTTKDDVPVYSNVPLALCAVAGVNATRAPSRVTGSLTDLEGHWPAESGSALVWFRNNPSPSSRKALFSVEDLGQIARVVDVAQLSDGSIYRVSPR
jgi:hypothetical protein